MNGLVIFVPTGSDVGQCFESVPSFVAQLNELHGYQGWRYEIGKSDGYDLHIGDELAGRFTIGTSTLRVECPDCGAHLGDLPGEGITHRICQACLPRRQRQVEQHLADEDMVDQIRGVLDAVWGQPGDQAPEAAGGPSDDASQTPDQGQGRGENDQQGPAGEPRRDQGQGDLPDPDPDIELPLPSGRQKPMNGMER